MATQEWLERALVIYLIIAQWGMGCDKNVLKQTINTMGSIMNSASCHQVAGAVVVCFLGDTENIQQHSKHGRLNSQYRRFVIHCLLFWKFL